jgi:RHS repeat-associated protein
LVAWSGAPISPTAAAAPTYWWHADQGLVFYDVTQAAIMPTARARSEHFVLGQDPFTAVLSEFENFAPDIIHEVHRGQTDPLGQQRSADYDLSNRRVTRFTDYDGSTRTATFNAFSFPLVEIDPVGRQTTFTYDAHGNRLSKTMGSGSETSTWRWEYDTRGLTTAAIDANGNRTEYAYDANGHLVELIEPADVAGGSRAHQYFTYDTASQLTSHTDASGRTVTYAYDLRSRVIRTTYADASTELTTYGAGLLSGLEVAKQDRNQHLTTFGYDAAGRRVHTEWASSTPEVLVEDCTYVPGSALHKATCTRGGDTTQYTYDPRGRLIAERTSPVVGRALTTSFFYDEKSRAFSQSDPYGRYLYRVFDPVDRVTRTVQELVPGAIGTPAQVEALALATSATPAFTGSDIGAPALAGSSVVAGTVPGTGMVTIQGGGAATDLWAPSDELQYYSRPLESDATLTVRLDSQTQPDQWSKTGLMLRSSQAADAAFVAVLVSWNGISIQYRPSVGAAVAWPGAMAVPAKHAPVWLRAQSLATTVHLSMSDDGVTWTELAALPFQRVAGARIGLSVTSHTAAQRSTAVYSHVALQVGALDPAPLSNLVNHYFAALPRDLSVNPGYVIEDTAYDASGLVTARINGRGIRSTTSYDSQARMASMTEAAGTPEAATTTAGYDAQGNRIRLTNPRGFVTAMSYTGRNQVADMTEAFGTASAATTTYAYTPTRKVATMTDALGRLTTTTYEPCCDRVASITDPAGYVTTFAYDSVGNRTAVTDANGLTTLTTFDARNRPVTVTNGAGETTTLAYTEYASALPEAAGLDLGAGSDGFAIITTNPLGERSLEIRDGLGRTIRQVDALGHATTRVYDALVADAGATLVATSAVDPLGHTTTDYQDGAGRTRVRLDALHLRNTFGYDGAGNRVSERDANGVGKDVTFDARNRAVTSVDTAGAITHTAYDGNSNVVASTDALGQVDTSVFDARDRKVSTTDRIGATTIFTYDTVSNLTSITDAEGGVTLYHYDERNLLDREVFPQGQSARTARYYAYDPGRRLISRTVAGIPLAGAPPATPPLPNELTTYAYDAANRLIGRGYPDHLDDAFTYDTANRLTAATSARYANQVARRYDAAGRQTKETLSFTHPSEAAELPVSYAYDADHQVTQLTYPDGSQVQRTYTPRHELEHIWDGGATVIARAYDVGGRLGVTQYGNGLKEFRTYVPHDNLVAAIVTTGNVTNFSYAYDANKRKTEERDWVVGGNSQRFSYDAQSRVTGWNRGNGPVDATGETDTWHLSPVGDWKTFNRQPHAAPAIVENRTHDPVHELLAINGLALAYDVKGNLTHDQEGQDFTWDFENRLATANHLAQGQGDSATYSYDALGRRVKKAVTTGAVTVPTYFVNAGAQEVIEITGDITAFNDPAADPEDAGAAPYSPITGEGARGSLLADPTAQRFNFQPAGSDTPDGWLADIGGLQATSSSRGWTEARTPVDRDHLGRPLYDTFIQVDAAIWKLPVANGTHAVAIMCGDADSRAQTNNLMVNGVSLVDATPYDGHMTMGYETGAFDGYALTVTVTDGFVTLQSGAGALNLKINFIEVGGVGTAIDAPTTARVQAAAEQATHDTAKQKAKVPPVVKRNVWGAYVDELCEYTIKQPRKAPVRYFVHANHLFSLSAATSNAGQVVSRYSYDAYGKQTIRNSLGAVVTTSDPVGLGRGFTGYRTDLETGLYYARARMYSSRFGRFISFDSWRSTTKYDNLIYRPYAEDGYPSGSLTYGAYFVPNSTDPTGEYPGCDWSECDSGSRCRFVGVVPGACGWSKVLFGPLRGARQCQCMTSGDTLVFSLAVVCTCGVVATAILCPPAAPAAAVAARAACTAAGAVYLSHTLTPTQPTGPVFCPQVQ